MRAPRRSGELPSPDIPECGRMQSGLGQVLGAVTVGWAVTSSVVSTSFISCPGWSTSGIRPFRRTHLTGMFPQLPGQSGYGKRLRAAGPLIAAVITELARDVDSWHDLLRLVDSTPLPCAASRETVKRSDLAGHAGYGRCPSHSRYFWGFRLYLICTGEGMPIIWGLANPKIGEREVTQALLEHDSQLVRTGQVILGDKGFAGREFEAFIHDELGAHLV